jgi:hypothetical protein
MSAADDLQKLSELLQKGLLTQEEFDKQKKLILEGKKKKTWPWWQWTIAIVVSFFIFIISFSKDTNWVPVCDGSTAEGTLIEAFDTSQFAKSLNLSAIEVSNKKEVSFDKDIKLRVCTATITMNNTEKVDVEYKMEGRDNGKYMLTFETK